MSSVNSYKPHVWVLPEDDANRQLANGFILHPRIRRRSIRIPEEAGGWRHTVDSFLLDYAADMKAYTERRMILLIDFDRDTERVSYVESQIPAQLA